MPEGLEIPTGVLPPNPVPVDAWSGPYTGATESEAKANALASVPLAVRFKTLTVRLVVNGIGKVYWWKDGIADNDLIEQFEGVRRIYVSTYAEADPLLTGSVPLEVFVAADETYYEGEASWYKYDPQLGAALFGIDFNYKDEE